MKLSIIIVSWNVKEEIINCLRSVESNRPRDDFEVVTVDNASSDGTVDAIRLRFPHTAIIANDENRGFAAANNQGIERSRGQYLLFLNPDTFVHSHTLDVLIEFMDRNSDVGACGPKILNEDGTAQQSVCRFPTFRAALHRYTIFKRTRLFRREYHNWLMRDFTYDTQADVDQLMGSALMVRRSVMEQVGRMDERFFLYFEEVDLCLRIKKAGWRVVFTPNAAVTHLAGKSSQQMPLEAREMLLASLLGFFEKNRGTVITWLFGLVFKPAVLLANDRTNRTENLEARRTSHMISPDHRLMSCHAEPQGEASGLRNADSSPR